jgi:hypothetical protein
MTMMALIRLVLGIGVMIAIWMLGRFAANLRGARPPNTIRYEGDLLGVAALNLAFGIGFVLAYILDLPGWRGIGPIFLAACTLLASACISLAAFRFEMVVSPDDLSIQHAFSPGRRSVPWTSVLGWKLGRKSNCIILFLDSGTRLRLTPAFKEGFDCFLDALDARNVSQSE